MSYDFPYNAKPYTLAAIKLTPPLMKLFFIFLICIIAITSYGQDSIIPNSKPKLTDFVKYSSPKRLSIFPFSKAKQIKIVSFHWQRDTSNGRQRVFYSIPLSNDIVDQSKLDETIALNSLEIDTLTDILYNECSKWTITEQTEMGCFLPRNAIVFYDQESKPIECIEICFECHGFRKSNKEIESPDKCDLMFDSLQNFFQKHGLRTKATELIKQQNSR